jgi:hypothetical protein
MLGLSEAILRLAAGEDLHPGLSECSPLPPQVDEPPVFTMHGRRKYYQCHRQLPALEEPLLPADTSWFIPLWAFRGGITGIWEREGQLEFVDYSVELPEDGFEFIARTEQGLLAYILIGVVDEYLPAAAKAVGFRFLNLYSAALASGELTVEEGLKKVIAHIDALTEPPRRIAR